MIPIVVFYHCFIFGGDPPELKPWAFDVVFDHMVRLKYCGLADAATEIIIGINGGPESQEMARVMVPRRAKIVLHGLESKNENPTIVLMEDWVRSHPGEAHILYFHAKSSSHDPFSDYGKFECRWKECMTINCVENWRKCLLDLRNHDAVGCHWLTEQGSDESQSFFAGTFFWSRASFLRTLPSIMKRDRIRISGLSSPESRFEAEVWIGNGPRLPIIRDYHPGKPWKPNH